MALRAAAWLGLAVGFMPQGFDACGRSYDCLRFVTPRIEAGQVFSTPLQRGLEFRLNPEPAWHITVGPDGRSEVMDFLWPVSPPLGSSRQLFIGPSLNFTADESLRWTPRRLRYVLNGDDYAKAEALNKEIIATFESRSAEREALGKGTLTLDIVGSEVRDGTIRWIEVKGESCVPK
jgi:hypothetical protein